jgi:flagellar biosynthesis GTPase FlhF
MARDNLYPLSRIKIMDKCLFDAKAIFDSIQVPFFLCTGTALGFIREGGFIQHDYDIDIAVEEDIDITLVINSFTKSGKFQPVTHRKIGNVYVELSFRHVASRIQLDIFVSFRHGSENTFKVLWDFKTQGGGNPVLLYFTPYGIKNVAYQGVEFQCADELYLSQTYGPDWRTPVDFKKLGHRSPYLASLSTKHRPNLLDVSESKDVLEEKFQEPHAQKAQEEPVAEPQVEKPQVEKPQVEEQPVEQQPVEQQPVEQQPVEKPQVEEPQVEEPQVEQQPVEQQPVEEQPVEEQPVEEPQVEEPQGKQVEEPQVEEPQVEQPQVEQQLVEEQLVEEIQVEKLPVEEPQVEEQPVQEHLVEERKVGGKQVEKPQAEL